MKIGLISDTHGVFGPEFREFLSPCDEIWHAGDFGGGLETAAEIAAFKPLVGVAGNCDDRAMLDDYPIYRHFVREGHSILMTHIGGYPGHYDIRAEMLIRSARPEIFVCGHSHILKVMYDDQFNMMCLNPGAAGLQGWHLLRTALRFNLGPEGLSGMEVFKLER